MFGAYRPGMAWSSNFLVLGHPPSSALQEWLTVRVPLFYVVRYI